ncbi:hypothetical protein [Caldithrix abyssi]
MMIFKAQFVNVIFLLFSSLAAGLPAGLPPGELPWQFFVRTSGHPLTAQTIDSIIADAQNTHLFGIEVDNDITGRYDSFLNPQQKLNELRALAKRVHAVHNYAFVYIAGLECITPDAPQRTHTFFKDHPDWVQRDLNGRPAVFGSQDAFWIREGDEDVWISPFAQPWRQMYMERVRQIAATGIDGVYVDIPYWMTHFEGWENTWASFDDFTVRAFKEKTGIDARSDLQLGDFSDPNFLKWIDFRLQTIRDFLAEIDRNVKQVNPNCLTIAEIYPGIDFEAVRVGADASLLYPVVDVIAHEYSQGAYMASDRQPLDWFKYIVGMLTFRALAHDKATWMLSYSWDGNPHVRPADAMRLLFAAQLFAGANSWDAATHVMSGSNDYSTRRQVFKWIAQYKEHFYGPARAVDPIGIYFSAQTRNYHSDAFTKSFTGFVLMALHAHLPFQIVDARALNEFKGRVLILPNVKRFNAKELKALAELARRGVRLIITANSQQDAPRALENFQTVLSPCPGKQYHALCAQHFNRIVQNFTANDSLSAFAQTTLQKIAELKNRPPAVRVSAPPAVAFKAVYLNEKLHLALVNFSGIQGGVQVVPQSVPEITIEVHQSLLPENNLTLLPYLRSPQTIKGQKAGDYYRFKITHLSHGVFLWQN